MEKVILFDGTNTDGWKMRESGAPANWTIDEDGVLHVGRRDLVSKYEFGDAHIHVEFRTPDLPDKTGQWKGNSGVYVHSCYEIQILDSYGIEHPTCSDCGGLYSLYAPLVNACRPAMEWQSYDIILKAAKLNEDGSIKEHAVMTVIHNSQVIHNNFVLPSHTPGALKGCVVERGPLLLQDHACPVSFRNVWIQPLD